jgi:hypothetical protein
MSGFNSSLHLTPIPAAGRHPTVIGDRWKSNFKGEDEGDMNRPVHPLGTQRPECPLHRQTHEYRPDPTAVNANFKEELSAK